MTPLRSLLACLFSMVFLAPNALADVSVLGGAVVVHTAGDVGVSALGNPVLRIADNHAPGGGACGPQSCIIPYGTPLGLAHYEVWIVNGLNSCAPWVNCFYVVAYLPVGDPVIVEVFQSPSGDEYDVTAWTPGTGVSVHLAPDNLRVCVFSDSPCEGLLVETSPPCVKRVSDGFELVCVT